MREESQNWRWQKCSKRKYLFIFTDLHLDVSQKEDNSVTCELNEGSRHCIKQNAWAYRSLEIIIKEMLHI